MPLIDKILSATGLFQGLVEVVKTLNSSWSSRIWALIMTLMLIGGVWLMRDSIAGKSETCNYYKARVVDLEKQNSSLVTQNNQLVSVLLDIKKNLGDISSTPTNTSFMQSSPAAPADGFIFAGGPEQLNVSDTAKPSVSKQQYQKAVINSVVKKIDSVLLKNKVVDTIKKAR